MKDKRRQRADLQAQARDKGRTRTVTQYAVAIHDGSGWTVILEDATSEKRAREQALVDWIWPVQRTDVKRAENVAATEDGCPIRGHPQRGPADFPS